MFEMTQYNEKEADALDRLIRAVLLESAEKMTVTQRQKLALLNRIKNEAQRSM